MFGQVIGVVVSPVETDGSGRPISGIGFAIPINEVKTELGGQVSPAGPVLPTPTPLAPAIGPTPDIEATKTAIDAIDAFRRASDQATQAAVDAQATAEQYAADLEATRCCRAAHANADGYSNCHASAHGHSDGDTFQTPTPEPTATPTPTPTLTPTPTPHPATFCREWEALVLEWIKQGNYYSWYTHNINPDVPDHPQLPARWAHSLCLTSFPVGVLYPDFYQSPHEDGVKVGYG